MAVAELRVGPLLSRRSILRPVRRDSIRCPTVLLSRFLLRRRYRS